MPEVHVVELTGELALECLVEFEENLAGPHLLDTALVHGPTGILNCDNTMICLNIFS